MSICANFIINRLTHICKSLLCCTSAHEYFSCFGHLAVCVCAWKVVNLVSIYHCYEHFCTIFCFAFLSYLSLYRFVSIYFSFYTFCVKLQQGLDLFVHLNCNKLGHSNNIKLYQGYFYFTWYRIVVIICVHNWWFDRQQIYCSVKINEFFHKFTGLKCLVHNVILIFLKIIVQNICLTYIKSLSSNR